jgi:hypothetical protein
MPILSIFCYNGSLVTWTVVSLATAKFNPLIFSLSGFALSYTANMFILMTLYDFCLFSCTILLYINVYIRKVESCAQIADRCAPWKISIGAENLVSMLCLPPAFTLVSCSVWSSTLKMETIYSSDTSVDFQRTTRRYIPENSTLRNHRGEDLRSYTALYPRRQNSS